MNADQQRMLDALLDSSEESERLYWESFREYEAFTAGWQAARAHPVQDEEYDSADAAEAWASWADERGTRDE